VGLPTIMVRLPDDTEAFVLLARTGDGIVHAISSAGSGVALSRALLAELLHALHANGSDEDQP
jgi:hypothetical protein